MKEIIDEYGEMILGSIAMLLLLAFFISTISGDGILHTFVMSNLLRAL